MLVYQNRNDHSYLSNDCCRHHLRRSLVTVVRVTDIERNYRESSVSVYVVSKLEDYI